MRNLSPLFEMYVDKKIKLYTSKEQENGKNSSEPMSPQIQRSQDIFILKSIVKLLEYETQIANSLKHFLKNLGEILPSSPAMKSNRLHIGLNLIFNPVLFYQSADALFR